VLTDIERDWRSAAGEAQVKTAWRHTNDHAPATVAHAFAGRRTVTVLLW